LQPLFQRSCEGKPQQTDAQGKTKARNLADCLRAVKNYFRHEQQALRRLQTVAETSLRRSQNRFFLIFTEPFSACGV
jgi:hypothetical protein